MCRARNARPVGAHPLERNGLQRHAVGLGDDLEECPPSGIESLHQECATFKVRIGEDIMRRFMIVATVLVFVLGLASVAAAGEGKAKIEKGKAEMKAEAEEAKGEAKALKDEMQGKDFSAKTERAKGKMKAAGERAKGKIKEGKAKAE
jgi:hypothetical protein